MAVQWMIYLYLPLKNGDLHVFVYPFFFMVMFQFATFNRRESRWFRVQLAGQLDTMEDHLTVTSFSTYGFNSVMYSVCYIIYIITYVAIQIYTLYL